MRSTKAGRSRQPRRWFLLRAPVEAEIALKSVYEHTVKCRPLIVRLAGGVELVVPGRVSAGSAGVKPLGVRGQQGMRDVEDFTRFHSLPPRAPGATPHRPNALGGEGCGPTASSTPPSPAKSSIPDTRPWPICSGSPRSGRTGQQAMTVGSLSSMARSPATSSDPKRASTYERSQQPARRRDRLMDTANNARGAAARPVLVDLTSRGLSPILRSYGVASSNQRGAHAPGLQENSSRRSRLFPRRFFLPAGFPLMVLRHPPHLLCVSESSQQNRTGE